MRPEILEQLAPMVASVAFFMVPIVFILTRHQREMAKLMNGPTDKARMEALEQRLEDLARRSYEQQQEIMMLRQTLIMESRARELPGETIENRAKLGP